MPLLCVFFSKHAERKKVQGMLCKSHDWCYTDTMCDSCSSSCASFFFSQEGCGLVNTCAKEDVSTKGNRIKKKQKRVPGKTRCRTMIHTRGHSTGFPSPVSSSVCVLAVVGTMLN